MNRILVSDEGAYALAVVRIPDFDGHISATSDYPSRSIHVGEVHSIWIFVTSKSARALASRRTPQLDRAIGRGADQSCCYIRLTLRHHVNAVDKICVALKSVQTFATSQVPEFDAKVKRSTNETLGVHLSQRRYIISVS